MDAGARESHLLNFLPRLDIHFPPLRPVVDRILALHPFRAIATLTDFSLF